MYVTDRNGRKYRIPTQEETKRIREGIALDPDTRELTDDEMAELRPLAELKRSPGRPQADMMPMSLTPPWVVLPSKRRKPSRSRMRMPSVMWFSRKSGPGSMRD